MKKNLKIVLLMLVSLFAISANGAPMAFSVNSDSGNLLTDDSLYVIDLATGNDQSRGELISGVDGRWDTEGLAFAPDGQLWGIDDDSLTLFPINTASGAINIQSEISLTGFPSGGGNDFGMTFSCDNTLYITSVIAQTLYTINMDGSREVVGAEGALGQNISAIASIGNPTRLYGLGNGQFEGGETDSPNLYSIDPQTGVATFLFPLGAAAGEYGQGGLAFDTDGTLYAITDRRLINNSIADLPSQVLRIDIDSQTVTLLSTTTEVGFESLAIVPPTNCAAGGNDDEEFPVITTLGPMGRLLGIFVLLLSGSIVLRRRFSK
jgi:hypothetical protein